MCAAGMQGRRGVILQSFLLGAAAQVVRGFGVSLVFVSLGYPNLWAACLAVAPIVMFVTMVPAGLSSMAVGAGAMVLLLEPLGVPPEASLSASLLSDVLVFIMIPLGAICFAASGYWRAPQGAGGPNIQSGRSAADR
jgi:hypothetical protein